MIEAPLLPGGQRFLPVVADGTGPRPRVLMIDNYDSFTFNLVQFLLELGAQVDVYRNDKVTSRHVIDLRPTHVVLSPGPGRPQDSGVCQDLCRDLVQGGEIPLLGVCLGHQTLCEIHGAKVVQADRIMHGKLSAVKHDGRGILAGLPSPFEATRYHSLIVEEGTLPSFLTASGWTPEGELMAVRHESLPIFGVQFHPESILTQQGHALLGNFLDIRGPEATSVE